MVWKKVIIKMAEWLLIKSVNALYNYIDEDNDGKLSKKELKSLKTKIEKIRKGW